VASSEVANELALRVYGQHWPITAPGSLQEIEPGSNITLECGWRLEPSIIEGGEAEWGDYSAAFDLESLDTHTPIVVRTRRLGDRIEPWGMVGKSKSLQDLLVDAKIPTTIRDRLALVADAETGEVLWVPGPGGRRSRKAGVTSDTKRILQLRFYREQMESESV
jgi:tRNA(Ile)-lysidine synthase